MQYSTIILTSDRKDRGLLKIYYLYSSICIKYVNTFPTLLLFLPETEGDSTGEYLLCQSLAELLHFLIQKADFIILCKDKSCEVSVLFFFPLKRESILFSNTTWQSLKHHIT